MAPPSTQYGPFAVTRPLVRAPGAQFLEGRDPEGNKVILQIIHLRAPGANERASIRAHVRMVARATEYLDAHTALDLVAHGSVDQEDGATSLYWTLPWTPGAERLGLSSADVPSVEALGHLASTLLARTVERHAVGHLDPLLSPETVVFNAQGMPTVVGFPIHLPRTWRSPDVRPAPLAPEEEAIDEPRRSGDLWRVGRVLEVLGSRFSEVPSALRESVARLTAAVPSTRYTDAKSALRDMEAAQGTGASPAGLPRHENRGNRFGSAGDRPVTGILDLFDETTSWDDKPGPWADGPGEAKPAISSPSEDTSRAVTAAQDTGRSSARSGPPDPGDLDGPHGSPGTNANRMTPEHPAATREDSDALTIRGRPVPEPDERARARYRPRTDPSDPRLEPQAKDPARPDSLYGMVPPARELVDDDTSYPPEGSELHPTAIRTNDPEDRRSDTPPARAPLFPFSVAAPLSALRSIIPRGAIHPLALAVAFASGVVVAAVFLFLVGPPWVGSIVAGRAASGQSESRVVTPAHEVLLQASPRNAIVLSETTGRILGTPPIRFLVPERSAHAVFIAASGHEPQRLILPLRGRIRIDLVPLARSLPACKLHLTTMKGVRLEAVAAPVQFGPRTSVLGAAIVRSNQGYGAWLVRCPRLGGRSHQLLAPHIRNPTARLEVSGPRDATIIVDNENPEPAPLERVVPTGFRKLQVIQDGAETLRFVPVFTATSIRMPKPRRR